ncbi:MAG: DUF305 domain-containing protein [Phenylobacterium sp.]|jgi:hypothetical protein|uniref:DUF305 domain-containing protein n=2 Tax=Brevundimonas sp. TaxID=1871086 RepID=UPI0027240041|nr:DUF305 domain-containing protein [Brevundimonas sp.]MDO9077407.1 DUF305 domain-containing protein [Brevundimonas sp.]MDZ4373082.1 DUF305 domain-containing protein [Phenylobacterium sp.]HWQ85599.1 DUF305 domain-containing protein [Brevundimonas sp.]
MEKMTGMNHTQAMKGSYRSFAIELVLDFIIMYLVMYTMIASLDHFYFNLNNVYMTLMMVSPMAILMLVFMRSMYPSKRTNLLIGGAAALVFAVSFWGMRTQAAVGDAEFLRSMIPHHSGAILMCNEAELKDPEVLGLCEEIVSSQAREIAQMKALLARR